MPTIELYKDGDRVIVDIGSDPEQVWRAKGFSEEKSVAVKAKEPESITQPEKVEESEVSTQLEGAVEPAKRGRPPKQ